MKQLYGQWYEDDVAAKMGKAIGLLEEFEQRQRSEESFFLGCGITDRELNDDELAIGSFIDNGFSYTYIGAYVYNQSTGSMLHYWGNRKYESLDEAPDFYLYHNHFSTPCKFQKGWKWDNKLIVYESQHKNFQLRGFTKCNRFVMKDSEATKDHSFFGELHDYMYSNSDAFRWSNAVCCLSVPKYIVDIFIDYREKCHDKAFEIERCHPLDSIWFTGYKERYASWCDKEQIKAFESLIRNEEMIVRSNAKLMQMMLKNEVKNMKKSSGFLSRKCSGTVRMAKMTQMIKTI